VRECAANIAPEHFQLPVAQQDDEPYRERVYCYELYYYLRTAWQNGAMLGTYHLSAEVDKAAHPVFRDERLLRLAKPDFVIHRAGTMQNNLAVVEVKTIETSMEDLADDVKKVAAFIRRGRYSAGVCLIYGIDNGTRVDDFRRKGRELLRRRGLLSRVLLLHHGSVGEPAKIVPWNAR